MNLILTGVAVSNIFNMVHKRWAVMYGEEKVLKKLAY